MTRVAETARAAEPGADTGALIEADGLHKSFGATEALRGASMSLGSGEIVAVMGPSGSGKSTLLHCVAGIVPADSGEVRYAGTTLSTLSDSQRTALRRGEFGFVFQFGQLVPELSCVENVALPLRLDGMRRRKAERTASRVMERLLVDDLAAKRPGEISGGQGQRVAVARALVTEPRLIFADEPTGALDSHSGEQVMELFQSLNDEGVSILMITHDAEIASMAQRTVEIRDGMMKSKEVAKT